MGNNEKWEQDALSNASSNSGISKVESLEFTDVNDFIRQVPKIFERGLLILLFGTIKEPKFKDRNTFIVLSEKNFMPTPLSKQIASGSCILVDQKKFAKLRTRYRGIALGYIDYMLSESIVLEKKDVTRLEAIFNLFLEECMLDFSEFKNRLVQSYLDILLVHVARVYHDFFTENQRTIAEIDKKFTTYCQEAFSRKNNDNGSAVSLGWYAKQLGVSNSYLNDLSLALHQRSAQDRLDQYIVLEAKRLLSQAHLSTAEIAKRIGFSEPQKLNRLFKKRTGKTPMEFRISLV